jgi:hypothetical protein
MRVLEVCDCNGSLGDIRARRQYTWCPVLQLIIPHSFCEPVLKLIPIKAVQSNCVQMLSSSDGCVSRLSVKQLSGPRTNPQHSKQLQCDLHCIDFIN